MVNIFEEELIWYAEVEEFRRIHTLIQLYGILDIFHPKVVRDCLKSIARLNPKKKVYHSRLFLVAFLASEILTNRVTLDPD